ncbi:hypothetical protein IZ6_10050 [Terrihabitans soli]|uniref:Uncharacterized protein n=1 Tax=Terrihabitans soli TaxID=708113 RepID=A0A6S6QTL6_9HYPH|nr:hypothetical protein [Terrihabitans soli]BCJ90270.1 hypothetical protein IZ6_10050 [Terrihabitans soli]
MMFILRAIFWLAVVSAFLPSRHEGEPGYGEQAGRMVGAAMDYCAKNPGECVGTAKATADAIRIPADFILRAQQNMAPAPSRPVVPQPLPRPASL